MRDRVRIIRFAAAGSVFIVLKSLRKSGTVKVLTSDGRLLCHRILRKFHI